MTFDQQRERHGFLLVAPESYIKQNNNDNNFIDH